LNLASTRARCGIIRVGLLAFLLLMVPRTGLAAQINLAWDASPGTVAGYVILYGNVSGSYTSSVDVGNQTTGTIPGLTVGNRYYFVVKAYTSAGVLSAASNEVNVVISAPPPPTIPPPFTDDPLVPGVHSMRAVHITELRTRIDALRATRGLGATGWTTIVAGSSFISASDIVQMRTALNGVYQSLGLPAPIYSDGSLGSGMLIRSVHISELRTHVKALE
jgi:hypothetical protein